MKDDRTLPSDESREKSQEEPRMLSMHKAAATTSDGTRELIFYTFSGSGTEHRGTK